MRPTPPRQVKQELRIKEVLIGRGLTMASLARALNAPAGSVASNIYGYRHDQALRARIAAYLGMPLAELFDGDGQGRPPEVEILPIKKPGGRFLRAVLRRAKEIFQDPEPGH